MSKKAIIIGAGPAGLTAAYELLKRTDIKPIILEKSGDIGGISKTINYKGNRMDIGGHRFFSKSDRVMKWWMNIMPIQQTDDTYTTITYQRKHRTIKQEETHLKNDDKKVMLIRKRLSRIYFLRKFFTYPIQLSLDTLQKVGLIRTVKILLSYLYAQIVRRKPEKSLEDFMINRFGKQLYLLFFKDYTEKVWGVPCNEISAEWGAQRIKGISISKAIQHAAKSLVPKKKGTDDITQKGTETSLIENFLYPALGPGQLWEEVARQIIEMGGEIHFHQDVKEIGIANTNEEAVFAEQDHMERGSIFESLLDPKNYKQQTSNHKLIHSVTTINSNTGESSVFEGDYFFSTMPVQELIAGMNGEVPQDVKEVAAGLQYRDFITVGVLLQRLASTDSKTGEIKPLDLKDTWIYIQEKDVKVGRLQLFNNWSPYMVNEPGTVWIGMEYFCDKGDEFWGLSDEDIQRTAIEELEKMGLAQVSDVLDSTVHRVEKTYPAYFGTYDQFDKVRAYIDQFENLFLVGRNGMHKYNNSDHSMLTAMVAVDNICESVASKENIWEINTEQEYHEEKNIAKESSTGKSAPEPGTLASIANGKSFINYIWYNHWNRGVILLAGILIIVQFSIFKILYPFAGFINGDSYVYLQTAFWNSPINTYPVGYSNFLRLISVFTTSDTVLVGIQYILIQASALFLILSLCYFYRKSRFVIALLSAIIVLNPIFLYLSNYVSSDPFFLSMSLLWFALLLWIIERPTLYVFAIQAIVLFIAFTVRYNALYYPALSAIALLLSRQKVYLKFIGMAWSILLITVFIWNTSTHFKTLTGIRQFSPFTGWQMANNALYAYRYVDSSSRKSVPLNLKKLDNMVRHYFDTSRNLLNHPQEMLRANTWYMWNYQSPLQTYMDQQFNGDSTSKELKRWATMGPLYMDYGDYLIKAYPLLFFKYYISENVKKYYAPPLEFLETYNTGKDSVGRIAKQWFRYKSNKVKNLFKNNNVTVLSFFPTLAGILNVLFIFSLLFFGILNGFRNDPSSSRALILSFGLWILNFGFSVFAAPIALRFQVFPIIISLLFTILLLEHIYHVAFYSHDRQPHISAKDQLKESHNPEIA